MGCVDKIKSIYSLFSKSEKKVADYILENQFEAYDFSIQQLAELTDSSASCVIRFVKKAGFESYTQFRLELAKESERLETSEEHSSLIEGINKNDSAHKLLLKYERFVNNTLTKTFRNVNTITLSNALKLLRKAHKIVIVGEGTSFTVGEDFCRKLLLIGIDANFTADSPTQLSLVNNMGKNDVLILLSYSGNSNITNVALKCALERSVHTIAISQNLKSSLASQSDVFLGVPDLQGERDIGSVASRTAMMMICDLLYLGIAKSDIEQTKHNVKESRSLMRKLKIK